jgi:hypothetical protein
MTIDWDVAEHRRQAWLSAQRDWWAHLAAHKGHYAQTLACVHIEGACHGDGEEIRARVARRYQEYQEVLNA